MLGFGLGLRTQHYSHVLESRPKIDWFEVISENFMIPGGRPLRILNEIRKDYPVVLHGVSLSLGTPDPLNQDYLKNLKSLIDKIQPPWFSDHLCWTSLGGHYSHDLLPLPYNDEALKRVISNIDKVQDFMGRQMLVENVSSYVTYKSSEMTEWEFLSEVVSKTGCKLLLDVNNIYVSSRNHGFNPVDFLNGIQVGAVGQMHLAGHTDNGDHLIDTHDHAVCDPVWGLYKQACRRFGAVATMIERDANIPEFSEIQAEMVKAKSLQEKILSEAYPSQRSSKNILEESSIH